MIRVENWVEERWFWVDIRSPLPLGFVSRVEKVEKCFTTLYLPSIPEQFGVI